LEQLARTEADETLAVARELLEDAELSRLVPDRLLLRAIRLAALAGPPEIVQWLKYERDGYPHLQGSPIAAKYARRTGRVLNTSPATIYYGSLAYQDGLASNAAAHLAALRAIRPPPPQKTYPGWMLPTPDPIALQIQSVTTTPRNAVNIRAKVVGLIHEYAVGIYHQAAFSSQAEGLFEAFKGAVDGRLAGIGAGAGADLLERLETVPARLAAGDPESISQCLNTCRRLIDATADILQPAAVVASSPQTGTVDGTYDEDLNAAKTLNRLELYVAARVASSKRRQRMRQTLRNLRAAVCKGVHADVAAEEARVLVLQTYLALGELLALPAETPGA
jgi:hypothetical protein